MKVQKVTLIFPDDCDGVEDIIGLIEGDMTKTGVYVLEEGEAEEPKAWQLQIARESNIPIDKE